MPFVSSAVQALLALTLFSHSALAADPLTACPTTGTVFQSTTGAKYATCPETDYQGPDVKAIEDVPNLEACVSACEQDTTCLKAVYAADDASCHFKSNDEGVLTWAADVLYTTVYLDNAIPEQSIIATCPYVQTVYVSAVGNYTVCPDTDYRGDNVQQVNDVADTMACVNQCAGTQGCTMAVYDPAKKVCSVKGDPTNNTIIWSLDKRYDTIRLDTPAAPATQGQWSDLIRLPVIPVAAYVVPAVPESTRLMMFSSWGATEFGPAGGLTQFADYDFVSGDISARTVAETKHDMFCPGLSTLQDGRVIVSGGADANAVSIYDPATNNFTRAANMTTARGYQSSTTLSDGRVFTIGGAFSGPRRGKDGEVYDPVTDAWTALPDADVKPMLTVDKEGIWREDNHAWLVGWKNGTVFQAGPSMAQNWYGTNDNGSVLAAGVRDTNDAMCGIFAMYEPGKILSAGGSQDYTDSDAFSKAHITTIDQPWEPVLVEQAADMKYARGFANAVVLPDGQVLVTGGQKRSLVFTDTDSVLYPELYNPANNTWTVLAPEAVPRNYHSVSLLLADATVFSGGGGLCYVKTLYGERTCDDSVDHADGQIFSPPYLFNADGTPATRPVITATSEDSVQVGGTLVAMVDAADCQLVLVRIGTATHSVNTDQRRIPLTEVTVLGQSYTAQLPNDSGLLLPGYYYLFAVNSAGVPSVAKTIQIVL